MSAGCIDLGSSLTDNTHSDFTEHDAIQAQPSVAPAAHPLPSDLPTIIQQNIDSYKLYKDEIYFLPEEGMITNGGLRTGERHGDMILTALMR
jgi:hypothetical protein